MTETKRRHKSRQVTLRFNLRDLLLSQILLGRSWFEADSADSFFIETTSCLKFLVDHTLFAVDQKTQSVIVLNADFFQSEILSHTY